MERVNFVKEMIMRATFLIPIMSVECIHAYKHISVLRQHMLVQLVGIQLTFYKDLGLNLAANVRNSLADNICKRFLSLEAFPNPVSSRDSIRLIFYSYKIHPSIQNLEDNFIF